MIQPNELRIGNWVKYNLESPNIKLGGFSQMYVIDAHDMGYEYDPIPLTLEILEKCGFEGDFKNDWTLKPIFLMSGHNGYHLIMRKYNDGSDTSLSTEIQSLHQLQNLYFSLTGEELIYKL